MPWPDLRGKPSRPRLLDPRTCDLQSLSARWESTWPGRSVLPWAARWSPSRAPVAPPFWLIQLRSSASSRSCGDGDAAPSRASCPPNDSLARCASVSASFDIFSRFRRTGRSGGRWRSGTSFHRNRTRGPSSYGVLLGFMGAGAVTAVPVLQATRRVMKVDVLLAIATAMSAVVQLALAEVRVFPVLCGVMVIVKSCIRQRSCRQRKSTPIFSLTRWVAHDVYI